MTVSGLETAKVLTAALDVPTFTVTELAAAANVSTSTVNNVLARGYQDFFDCLGRDRRQGSRGAPPKRWTIRKDRLTDLYEIVREIRLAGAVPPESQDEDDSRLIDASLGTAVHALVQAAAEEDPESATTLIEAAKTDLVAAGFERDGVPLTNLKSDRQSAARARLIAAVSDVLLAKLTDDEQLIEDAQVRTYPAFVETKPVVVADEWLALVNAATPVHVVFDADPERAVRTFQQEHGLVADGIVGHTTYRALEKATYPRVARMLQHGFSWETYSDVARPQPQLQDLGFSTALWYAQFGLHTRPAVKAHVSEHRATSVRIVAPQASRSLSVLGFPITSGSPHPIGEENLMRLSVGGLSGRRVAIDPVTAGHMAAGDNVELAELAALVRARNMLDARLGRLLDRPVSTGSIGEWIAARIFDIELETAANVPGYDGHFTTGAMAGRTVSVKAYPRREGMLDIDPNAQSDAYLVLTGPKGTLVSSRGTLRPVCVNAVYLFDAHRLRAERVLEAQWEAAEIYPQSNNPLFIVSDEQRRKLELFGCDSAAISDAADQLAQALRDVINEAARLG